jgi:hypothetical protein
MPFICAAFGSGGLSLLIHESQWLVGIGHNTVSIFIILEGGYGMFLWNIGILLQVHTVLPPGITSSTLSLPWEPQVLISIILCPLLFLGVILWH